MICAFTKYIWRPVKNSLTEYRQAQVKYTKKYAEMLSRQNSRVDEEEGEGQKEDHTDIFVFHSPLSSPMLRSRS